MMKGNPFGLPFFVASTASAICRDDVHIVSTINITRILNT